jgi:TonB family protein
VAIVPVREGVFVRLIFGALAGAVSVLISASTLAQAPPESKSEATPPERTAIELFKAPHPKRIDMERFPLSETGNEGWVELAFMVDTSGKPFEVTVVRSTGNPTFEKIAMKSMEHSTFEPGKLNGAPIESGFEMKYLFRDERMLQSPGANPAFIKSYKTLIAALNSGERATAAEAMQKLKITNLYEDAYFGMATYNYASKYGNERQQLEGLRRAIAREDYARYLPRDLFRSALINCMQLELKDHQYAEALATWKRLQKAGIDKDSAARIREAVAKLEKIRTDDSVYAVSGQISDRNWYLHLFKRHFQAVVSEGYISEVRLRCDTRHWFFPFDASLQYEINTKDGDCSIELLGAPGTEFKLMQF